MIGGSGTDCLTLVREMSRKQESPPTFISSNHGKGKRTEKTFFRDILSTRGRLYRGKVLAPFLSAVIYGLLGTCSFFKLLVCVCLENVLLRDNSCISPQECDKAF